MAKAARPKKTVEPKKAVEPKKTVESKKRVESNNGSKQTNRQLSPEVVLTATQDRMERVRTKVIDFSFNELFDMYRNEELKIDPAYQRLFRWPQEKQSQFIESLVLELPIPAIYVVEVEEGRYELIDGLQRFSSYLAFRGHLKRDDVLVDPLVLEGCDIIRELNGLKYDDLPTVLQIRLKRVPIPVQILRKESAPRLRFHMFKRLNTGGEPLSSQEVRNATIRLLGTKFNDFIQSLASDPSFRDCVNLMTSEAKDRMGREECVLRFFAFKNDFENYEKLITPFLDDYMEQVTDGLYTTKFNYELEEKIFKDTFLVLRNATGEKTFSTVTKSGSLGNQFSMLHFDILTQGIQRSLPSFVQIPEGKRKSFADEIIRLKTDKKFRDQTTGGGKNYQSAYRKMILHVEGWLNKWLATA